MTAPKPGKTDVSFVILRLANKITLPNHPALLVLRFMAKCANNSGYCFPGYDLICAMCGIARSTLSEALEYLYELHLLTKVTKGNGNQHGGKSSAYRFSIPAMRHLVKHQGIYSPDDNDGKALLHGKALSARVKLLSSLTLPSEPSAEYDLRSAEFDSRSASTDPRSASTAGTTLTSSIEQLSVNPTPSVKQLPEQRENPPVQELAPVGRGVQPLEGVSQFVPPLSSPTLLSRKEQTITFDDDMWTSNKPQMVPVARDEPC